MIYKWFMKNADVSQMIERYAVMLFVMTAVSFVMCFIVLKKLRNILPKDHGREFAVNGELSQGKARGCGLLFITVFTLCTALFVPLDVEKIIYLACIYGAMLTGYLDDASETPWGNLKKGLFDLVISLGVAVDYYYFNGSDINLPLFDVYGVHIPAAVFIILAGILVWTAINVTNCTDGVDGLCCSLVMTVLISLLFAWDAFSGGFEGMTMLIMLAVLAAYLWFNCSPSSMLMGDAGSRALGVFLAVLFLRSRDPFGFIPMCIVIILDGGLSLLKVSFIRFLHMKDFMKNIRTPIHDHERKNKGWSDTQVVMRFTLIQLVIGICYAELMHR